MTITKGQPDALKLPLCARVWGRAGPQESIIHKRNEAELLLWLSGKVNISNYPLGLIMTAPLSPVHIFLLKSLQLL